MRQQKLRQKIQEIIMDLERRSGLNTIEGLIEKLCSEGVEFKTLGEIAMYPKNRMPVSELDKDSYVGVANLLPEFQGKSQSNYVPSEGMCIRYKIDDILIGNIRPYLKKIWLADISGGTNQDVINLRVNETFHDRITPNFLYYLLASDDFFRYHMSHARGGKMPRGDKAAVLKFRIPVPPLEVQNAIVEILDTFTALQQELEVQLEAELEERKKQYEYYREEQLSFDDNEVEYKTLGEIGELVRGSGIQKSDFTDFGVGCIHYGQIHTSFGVWADKTVSYISPELADRSRKASKGNLIITTTSEDDEGVAKAVAWIGDQDIAISTDALIFKHDLNPKYVSYLFQTDLFRKQKKVRITGTKVRRISANNLAKIKIPIPSLEKQKEIVATLDKFDALVNDLSIGIPAEIKARRLQLEYYQNHLLTFKKAPTDNKVT